MHTSDGMTILCAYGKSVGRGNVTDRYMNFQIKFAVSKLGYPGSNIPMDRIETHSNLAGEEFAIKIT